MIKVNANTFHESLQIDEEEITLNGPPGFLSGHILLKNQQDETVFIRELPLTSPDNAEAMRSDATQSDAMPASFRLLTSLRPGEERMQPVSLQIPATTPPGNYERTMMVGDRKKKIKIIVQANIDIDISPLNLHFQGVVAGKTYSAELTLTNKGNLPFKIPNNIKHTSMLDEDYLCRAMSFAIRKKGNEGFNATMDEMTRNIHREMADWVLIKIEESGQVIPPGHSIQVHFHLTLPEKVDSTKDYFGNLRIWNKEINYRINGFDTNESK